jgi:hypothetical protein
MKPFTMPDTRIPTRLESVIEKLDLACPVEERPTISVRGEALSEPIVWHRKQWAVTKHGLEARDGRYEISADRLWEDEKSGGWVQQMTLKDWVDAEDFIVSLALARIFHAKYAPSD